MNQKGTDSAGEKITIEETVKKYLKTRALEGPSWGRSAQSVNRLSVLGSGFTAVSRLFQLAKYHLQNAFKTKLNPNSNQTQTKLKPNMVKPILKV